MHIAAIACSFLPDNNKRITLILIIKKEMDLITTELRKFVINTKKINDDIYIYPKLNFELE
jgi:hypothetical protein